LHVYFLVWGRPPKECRSLCVCAWVGKRKDWTFNKFPKGHVDPIRLRGFGLDEGAWLSWSG
jgi:hypothetical protein